MADLDRDQLSEEFDIENTEIEVKEMVKQIDEAEEADVEEILKQNVNRSNRILDRIESEIENGSFSARLAEVASQLVNSVTGAASQISTDRYNTEYLQLRNSIVKLEKMKLRLKMNESGPSSSIGTQQNFIVTDRESLLKYLENKGKVEQIETVKQIQTKGESDD